MLYDNVPIRSIDADDMKTAMYGQETVRLALLENFEDMSVEIKSVGFGSGRKFTPSQNTTFSAIALLHKFGESIRISVFHNIYARHVVGSLYLRDRRKSARGFDNHRSYFIILIIGQTEDRMASEVIGRRKFIKQLSSMCAGFMTSRLWSANSSFAATQKTPSLEYRTLGKTGLKVTTVSMGVMNCSDIAVVLRAFDLGINFYDTADCYMGGRNEEMVGKAFQGKRDKVYLQTKVHAHDEKRMRASVERSLRRLRTDYIDVLVWHGHNSTDEVSDRELVRFHGENEEGGQDPFFRVFEPIAEWLLSYGKRPSVVIMTWHWFPTTSRTPRT